MVKFFTAGGTIDKVYFDAKSEYEVGPPQVAEILREANVTLDYAVEPVLSKDSLDMTDEDRLLLRQRIEAEPCPRIVVTHGTDTMVETAEVLGKKALAKTIVLTGAMVPYAFGQSDAVFNLGCAIVAVQLLPHGVYIAMNGKVFPWDNVRKNKEAGVFEPRTARD